MRTLALMVVAAAFVVPAYALTDPAAAPAGDQATPTTEDADGDNRRVCRQVEVTGSLIKRGRVCRTVAEWRRIQDNGNYNARKMVEDSASKQSGN